MRETLPVPQKHWDLAVQAMGEGVMQIEPRAWDKTLTTNAAGPSSSSSHRLMRLSDINIRGIIGDLDDVDTYYFFVICKYFLMLFMGLSNLWFLLDNLHCVLT